MDYIDFQLKIGPRVGENQYAVSSRSSSIGETSGVFTQPLTDEQLELFVLKVGLARRGVRRIHSPEWRAAQDFGQKLFRSLFTDEIRAAYLASHNDAVRQGKGLRVKLTLDAPELANYPWEFLYDPSTGQFLALFEDTPILRYIELTRPIMPLSIAPPLRILAVASSPKDFEQLDLARERRNLSQALDALLQAGLIELDWLASATLDALREQLLKRPYHIFHFIGHGGFDEREQDGVLIFENAQHYSNRVSGERLAVILGNHRTLRLAILNACEGARTSEQDPFAGTAMTLVRTGNLPAVIAMQFEISDTAAIDFASGFYGAIAVGRPVDAAVSQGRQSIFAQGNDVEWSTPVLYLRSPDGIIFQVDTSRAQDARNLATERAEQERVAREKLETERAEQERIAGEKLKAERAEQERIAREKLETERAEQERVAREKLETERAEQERVAREKLEAERAEQERIAREKLETERAEQERVAREKREAEHAAAALIAKENFERENRAQTSEPTRRANVPPTDAMPERATVAQSTSPAELPSPRRQAVEFGKLRTPFLLAELIWVLAMGFFANARDITTNVSWGIIFTLLIVGIVYWWGRNALSPRTNQILLVGLGVGFAVQMFAIFIFVKPLGDAVYETMSPAVGSFPTASADFILATLRAGLFAIIGGAVGLAVMARQIQNAKESESASPEETSTPEIVERVQTLPTRTLYIIAGIFMAFAFSTTRSSSLAFYYGDVEDLLRLQTLGIFAALGALLFTALGAYALGIAISNQLNFNRTSFIIFILGSLAATLIGIFATMLQFDVLGQFLLVGLLVGGSLAFALWQSNSKLSLQILGIIAAGWVVGSLIQGAIVAISYPSLLESEWAWLLPLEGTFGYKTHLVLQVGLVGIFIGVIAPVVGISFLDWQLRQTKQK